MITGGKAYIFNPKVYAAVLVDKEQDFIYEALQSKEWFQATKDKYDSLIKNGTWSLVPKFANQRIIGNKIVKYNTDDSLAKYNS